MDLGNLYNKYIDPSARGFKPGKPGPSQSIGTGGSRSSYKQGLRKPVSPTQIRVSERVLGRDAISPGARIAGYTPHVRNSDPSAGNPNAQEQFKQEYKSENPNQGSSRLKRSSAYKGLKAKQNFQKDIGRRIRAGGGFGYTGAAQGVAQGLLMTAAGWAGTKIGEYIADPISDAALRTLDATVGITNNGQQVDYDPVTNQFIKVKQQQKTSQNKSQGTGGRINAFGLSFDMSDPSQKAAYEKLQAEELKEQRNKRDKRHELILNGGNSGQSSDQVTLVNALGVPQTGTDGSKLLAKHEAEKKAVQESGIGNSLLQRLGIDSVQYGQFESNHFYGSQPTTGKVQKTNVDAELSGETPAQYLDSGKSTTNEAELPTKETKLVTSGIKPASDRAALGTRARYSQEFLADRPNMGDKYNESLVGLRAADASKGLLYASGQYWQENSEGGFDKIDKATYKRIKRGDQHALDFARDKIEGVKSSRKMGTNTNYDDDGFSVEDAYVMGMPKPDGRAIGSGGSRETVIQPKPADYPEQSALSPATTAFQPDMSSLAPDVRKAVELTDEPFSVMNSSEEKLREQLRAIKKR